MGGSSENRPEKHICTALLAHVDAGKTTLSESLLYLSGAIRKQGRVDHGDAFLDTYELERVRGITIFSKQAVFRLGDTEVTLLDTPGHVEFFGGKWSGRLSVIDYAVLIIMERTVYRDIPGHSGGCWTATGFRYFYLSIRWISLEKKKTGRIRK